MGERVNVREGFTPSLWLWGINFSSLALTNIFLTSLPLAELLKKWRRGRDSNPRGNLRPPTGLANPPLQPLEYLSIGFC